MLRERKELLEAEIIKLNRECGDIYLKIIKSEASELLPEYNTKTDTLSRMKTDLNIINHMISDGKE